MKKKFRETGEPLKKTLTGIEGLDEVLEGGLPQGRGALVTGETGTGKTVLLNEFIYRGITRRKENGIFVSFEENSKEILQDVGGFGWDYPGLIKQDKLRFVDAARRGEIIREIGSNYDFTPLVLRIREAIKQVNAQRVVIDNLNAFFMRFRNKNEIRATLNFLLGELKEKEITALISVEKAGAETALAAVSAEFVSDTIIELSSHSGQQKTLRELEVRKMRGAGYRSGKVEFEIGSAGIQIFPKIPVNLTIAATDFNVRKKFEVRELDDKILDGGIPQGQTVLISGNSGTGKTIMALQFIQAGLKAGEHGLYVGLEENIEELKKVAQGLGWDFARDEKAGKLRFLTASLIDLQKDRLLLDIVKSTEKNNIKRLVFDSASSLTSAGLSTQQARNFVIQLGGFLKMKGITSVFTYMMTQNFQAAKGRILSSVEMTNIQVSSLVDGLILLMFIEQEQEVKMVLNVLKMRGVNHSKDIYGYRIEKGGLVIEGKYGQESADHGKNRQ